MLLDVELGEGGHYFGHYLYIVIVELNVELDAVNIRLDIVGC